MTAAPILWGHALAALLFGTLALGCWRRRGRGRADGIPILPATIATALTALWALAVAGIEPGDAGTQLAAGARDLAWLAVMIALARRTQAGGPSSSALYAMVVLATLAAAATALAGDALPVPHHLSGALAALGALALLHRLARRATGPHAGGIRLFALALGAMWGLDLVLALLALAGPRWTAIPLALRGPVMAGVAILLGAAATHRGDAAVAPSRTVAMRALLAMALLVYTGLTVMAVEAAASLDPAVARAAQTAIVCGATAALLAFVSTPWLRAWLRVKVAKHLFGHRYDYRVEWQRFTATLGVPGTGAAPLGTRIAKAMADLTDSPAGLTMVAAEGALAPLAGWNWPDEGQEWPVALADHLGTSGRIVALDALRQGEGPAAERAAVPDRLLGDADVWAIVPLRHGDELAGAILLARPPVDRALDWEDFDLLRVAGRQAASYLAEDRSHAALADAQRFDEFNRRFAFLMHDIKNVASQLSLVARNAERHAGNPDFRADMIATLRDSTARMTTLLARLGQHDGSRPEPLQPIDLPALARRVAAARRAQHPVIVAGDADACALGQPARLEQALAHLVQNAVEASDPGHPVRLHVGMEGDRLVLAVIDRGDGMAPAFVRDRLFRPFVSSKPDGFGIGACEARQLVRAMGGELLVDSREGEGTRFRILLPAAAIDVAA